MKKEADEDKTTTDAIHDDPTDHPIAHPIASASTPPLTSTNTPSGVLNDGAHTGTTPARPRPKRRAMPRDIHQLAQWLSDRDLAVLQSVSEHRFLTVGQVEALHFGDHTPTSGARIARRTMARLRDYRILGTLQRSIGGVRAGSSGLVHYIDSVGDQLLRSRSGRLARRRSVEPSSRFVDHCLAVADAHIALVEADRNQTLELVDCSVEPAAWRSYTGLGGARLRLKTDLYADTAVPPGDEFVHGWFVEVDLGHEGINTLLKKCRDYEAYRRSGIEQDRSGSFPVVFWSMTHTDAVKAERRRAALRDAIDGDRGLPPQLFRIIAPQQLIPAITTGGKL
jgi:hypothetical protein